MVLGNDEVEFLLWILGIRGEFRDDVLKDCDLLGWFKGNADKDTLVVTDKWLRLKLSSTNSVTSKL